MANGRAIIIGGGTDGPSISITIVNGKVVIKRIPGWNPEQFVELGAALQILKHASRLKTPGLAESAAATVFEFTEKQLGEHVPSGSVLVV